MHDPPARLDRARDKQIHPAAGNLPLAAPLQSKIRSDPNDPAIRRTGPAELREHADLARGTVVDHRAVEPRD